MKVTKKIIVLAALAYSGVAYADIQDIQSANRQFSLQAITTHVDYTETFETGGVADTEKGHVPGYALSWSDMNEDNWYLQLSYSEVKGKTNYTGTYISGGAYGSVVNKSDAKISDITARWGKGFDFGQYLMLTPLVEAGHHEWDRGANDGENYRHDYLGLGAMLQYSPFQYVVLTANALVGKVFNATIDVPGSTGFAGTLDGSILTKFGLSADYAFNKHIHAMLGVDYTAFKYGRSPWYLTESGGVYGEPDSRTRYTTYRLGLGYSF